MILCTGPLCQTSAGCRCQRPATTIVGPRWITEGAGFRLCPKCGEPCRVTEIVCPSCGEELPKREAA